MAEIYFTDIAAAVAIKAPRQSGAAWIGAIRLVYVLHLQMFVNCLLHMTPSLPDGADSSRNIGRLGPLPIGAWGENRHQDHHADANAVRFGRR